jgi:hypothetical protein
MAIELTLSEQSRLHCHIQRVVVTPSLACLFIDYMHDENLNTISTF